jgi:hypothetical protein
LDWRGEAVFGLGTHVVIIVVTTMTAVTATVTRNAGGAIAENEAYCEQSLCICTPLVNDDNTTHCKVQRLLQFGKMAGVSSRRP